MKKYGFCFWGRIMCLAAAMTVLLQFSACTNANKPHFVDAVAPVDGVIDGANAYAGCADVSDSPYYHTLNYYDGNISNTLLLLKKFETYQQTSERSCGAACMIMIVNYLSTEVIGEDTLDKELDIRYYDNVREDGSYGASTKDLVKAFENRGYEVVSSDDTADEYGYSFDTEEAFAEYLKDTLSKNAPTMVENIEWGGHWMVVIGYDDMGSEVFDDDILVVADPYDTTDHCQDGYYTMSFDRFYFEWFDKYVMTESESVQQYITVYAK